MNMKKTIAAIAAGAMAVSAMASSVSALELKDQVLSYNLVQTYKVEKKGTVTLTATFRDVTVPTRNDLAVGVDAAEAASLGLTVKSLTVTGKYVGATVGSDTETIVPYTRSSDEGGENYDPNVKEGFMVVNVVTDPKYLTNPGGATAMNITVTAVCEHNTDQLKKVNDAIVAHKLAIWYSLNTLSALKDGTNNVWADDTISGDLYRSLPANEGTSTVHFADKGDYTAYDAYGNVVTDADKAAYAVLNSGALLATRSDGSGNPSYNVELVNGTTTASAFTANGKTAYKIPFKTDANNNDNIIYYLENANVRDEDHPYTNVLPVINDAIANYGTVTFTFHTATQGIAWTVRNTTTGEELFDHIYGRKDDGWADNADYVSRRYNEALQNYNLNSTWGERSLVAFYDDGWYADTSYKSFTQHLYNGTNGYYGSDSYYGNWTGFAGGEEYYGGLWGDNNLFGGALVINENRIPPAYYP